MIFSRNKKIEARRRFGSRAFRNKVRSAQTYKRRFNPIDLNRKSWWLTVLGFRSKFFRYLWLIIIIGLVYVFVFSDYLVVANVEVSSTNKISQDHVKEIITQLSEERLYLVPKSNFFLMTKSNLTENLSAHFPMIKDVTDYERSWPNKVSFKIIEREPGFILKVNEKKYLVDDEGIVLNDNPAPDLPLPLVVDQVVETFDIGSAFPNTKLVAFILSMHKQWGGKINSTIAETKIPGKASGEAQFVSSEGWTVFFDANRPVTTQLDNLVLVLTRQIPTSQRPNLAYIDLRLSKWAYYCYKDAPCVAGDKVELDEEGQPFENPVE